MAPVDPPIQPASSQDPNCLAPDIRHQDQGDLDDFIYDREGKTSDL